MCKMMVVIKYWMAKGPIRIYHILVQTKKAPCKQRRPTGYSPSVHWDVFATYQLVWVSDQGLTDPVVKLKLLHNLQDWKNKKTRTNIFGSDSIFQWGFWNIWSIELKMSNFSFSILIQPSRGKCVNTFRPLMVTFCNGSSLIFSLI